MENPITRFGYNIVYKDIVLNNSECSIVLSLVCLSTNTKLTDFFVNFKPNGHIDCGAKPGKLFITPGDLNPMDLIELAREIFESKFGEAADAGTLENIG